ncbi:SRPBCC family protein [Paeniglutamicibacter antarcticus]|uniref:SRPBCC family protein n=1 Tax=Arthrobacter terrae TaxID=2935737 RepID=A0A931CSF1_9MICC|nr:SRPBCC family protein [Arthrobacter terrae]MBG0741750.1 SRPBCC family protein [Arthrobacter terrae]
MTVSFECTTRTSMPKAQLFDLAHSIDAHEDSMAQSREKAVAGVTSGLISLGEEVTWRAWRFGVPLQMTSRITQMESPDYFIDEQVKGPFRRFRHNHEQTNPYRAVSGKQSGMRHPRLARPSSFARVTGRR